MNEAKRKISACLIVAAALEARGGRVLGADDAAKPAYRLAAHSDSQFAHELLRLRQVDVIKAQLAAAAGTAEEPLWKSELFVAQWDQASKETSADAQQQYVAAVKTYLESQHEGIDGAWALDHAQFILTKLSQPVITRMEYWANGSRDRQTLAPLAALADKLLQQSVVSLDAGMNLLESRKPFDEAAYMPLYAAAAEARYYAVWCMYYKAMALEPADPARQRLLLSAAAALNEWAVDEPDNGVNFQAYLLRGKALSEARDFPRALGDFIKAQDEKALNWVQYQARYQAIVTDLRAKEYRVAQTNLDFFKRWIPKDNQDAILSEDMLAYRVAWAMADTKTDAGEKAAARKDAVSILKSVIERDPRYRDLVYEQLAAQLPEDADIATLLPIQQIALAHFDSQNQTGQTPESRKQLKLAIDAATAVRGNLDASTRDKIEATYLVGVCNAVLNNLPEAAKYNVEFAEMAPGDPRAQAIVELALQQIGELRKIAGGKALSPELLALSARALHLSADTFGDARWKYAEARNFEDAGKLAEAAAIYEKLSVDDRNYLDARYRLVVISTAHFSQLPASSTEKQMQAAAADVFKTCSDFVALLDNPPASAPKDVLDRARTYRFDIWIIEAATALNPSVKQVDVALDRLKKLDDAKGELSETQKGAVLRYRIQAYQLAGQADKAFAVVEEYAKANGQDSMAVIRSMALSTVDEINKVEPTDPAEAKRLAIYVVKLLDPIIAQSVHENKKDSAFEYRLIQADMMVRAGQYAEAQQLAVALQGEKGSDIRPFITEARGIFAEAQATADPKTFAKAQDYFTRILQKLSPGSESYWESWLRILQSMEARNTGDGTAEIKKALGDLRGVYGSKFGGEIFKKDFDALVIKYKL